MLRKHLHLLGGPVEMPNYGSMSEGCQDSPSFEFSCCGGFLPQPYIYLYFDDNYYLFLVLPSTAFSLDGLPGEIK